jgi:hypothetical protein
MKTPLTYLAIFISGFTIALAAKSAYAQTPPPEPPHCIPMVRCIGLDGPHFRMGREGAHIFWSGQGLVGGPVLISGASCRWDKCAETTWTSMTRALTDASVQSVANRYQIVRRAWIENVTVDCELLAAEPFAEVVDAEKADWFMCRERMAFIFTVYGN